MAAIFSCYFALNLSLFGNIASAREFRPAIVYYGYKYDGSFLKNIFDGVERFEKETGIDVIEEGITEDIGHEEAIKRLIDRKANMILAVGFNWADAVLYMANTNTFTQFAIIDVYWLRRFNVAQYAFKEHEGSYIAGIYAALKSKTNKIGFIGGIDAPLIKKYACGFYGGAKSVNPDIEIVENMLGTDFSAFVAPAKGYFTATNQFNEGVDVIYHSAGGSSDGIIMAASEQDGLVIGTGSDQSVIAPNNVIASMVKRVDVAVYRSFMDGLNGDFSSDVNYLGLQDNGLDFIYNGLMLPSAEEMEVINQAQQQIESGLLRVHSYDYTHSCAYKEKEQLN